MFDNLGRFGLIDDFYISAQKVAWESFLSNLDTGAVV